MRLSMDDIDFIVKALRRSSYTYTTQEEKDKYNSLMRKLGQSDSL